MAKVLIGSDLGSYTFDKVAKTITFSGFTASLERVLMVTDTTNNTIIYQFNDPTKGGTLLNNILTLTYNTNTVAFNNTDALQIFYWSEEPQQVSLEDLSMILKRFTQLIERPAYMTALGNLKVDLAVSGNYSSAGGGLPVTVSNTIAVTNISGTIGGAAQDMSYLYWIATRQLVTTINKNIIS
jgi:hypothetical protein